jgi:serine protease Do
MRYQLPPRSRWALGAGLILVLACREAPGRQETSEGMLATAMQGGRAKSSVADSRRTALVEAAERLGPAVVSITVRSRQRIAPSPWDLFFVPQETEQISYGTGFVWRADGTILTNQHVVAGADSIEVTLPDGADLAAKLLGEDPLTDIAVLRIDRTGLKTATLGKSTDLMIGEWVVALGNPFAFLLGNAEPTVTAGVVSATGRNILPGRDQTGLYLDMIQTDAAINPGNSGGPLANALGEVVGVNSSIFSESGGSIGLGFAIPIERAARVADEIVRKGSVQRAWVGLDVAGAESMRDWKTQGGVLIANVAPGGPADRAGLHKRDVLTKANGRILRNFLDWEAVKLDLHVGDAVQITARQSGNTVTRTLVTGDLPSVTAEKVKVLKELELVSVTPQIQAEQGIASERGALIFRITDRLSEQTGLQQGDVILAINRREVRSAEEVRQIVNGMRPREPFRVYFERHGQISFSDLVLR